MADEFDDVGTLYGRFYDDARKPGVMPEVGQIVFCAVTEADRRLKIAEVRRVDSVAHTEILMHIREQQKGDFLGKDGRLPIKGLDLQSTQELIISRAKLRPCLVLACCDGVDASTIPDGPQRKLAEKAFHPIFMLAPVFSVSNPYELGSFGPVVAARIKCFMYPEFFYLRQSGGYIKYPSVARLDRVFVGRPHPGSGFESANLFLIPEIMSLALEQLRYFLGQDWSQEYVDLRDMMLAFLPAEAAVVTA